jgi:Glycosyl transferase family 2
MALQFLRSMKTRAAKIQHPRARFLLRPLRAATRLARWTRSCCDGTWDRQSTAMAELHQSHQTAIQQINGQLQLQQALIQQQSQDLMTLARSQASELQTSLLALKDRMDSFFPYCGTELQNLKNQVQHLSDRHFDLADQMDAFRSWHELGPEKFTEFQNWKKQHPISDNPRVSVCIATYNRAKLLTTRSLPSVLKQSYQNLEVIVVGDCCTDDTPERVEALGDSRVRFINLTERGQYPEDRYRRWMVAGTKPVNHALSIATGEYITHLDDDDEFLDGRIAKLVAFAQETQADFVWHPFLWEVQPETWLLHEAQNLRITQATTSSIFYRSWFKQIPWDLNAHLLMEPGDWNRIRKLKYLGAKTERFPEPLLRHYVERTQNRDPQEAPSKAA